MKRQLTAMIAALSLIIATLPGSPVEARSKKSNIVPLLLGAAALGLLLSQQNGGNAFGMVPTARPQPRDDDWDNNGYARRSDRTKLIPAECVMDVNSNGRRREVVSARCMDEVGFARRLPEECAFDIRTNAGRRTVYGQQCLGDYGYRLERARY